MTRLATGASYPAISDKIVLESSLPLPPLPEQRRIAAILDKADALRAKRREAIAKLDQLLQAVFLDMFGDPVTNPKGWPVVSLGDVSVQITDGAHHTPERQASGIPLLSARNVLMGHVDFENVDFVSPEEFKRLRKRCEPSRGDILISCSGTIGRVAAVRTDQPFTLVRSAALVKLNPEVAHTTYFEHHLRCDDLQRQMMRSARAVAQANLFQGPIRALQVMLPPLGEQQRFDELVARVYRSRESVTASLSKLNSLFTSLQHAAFVHKAP
jgi:type I restriction enzyme S subunit